MESVKPHHEAASLQNWTEKLVSGHQCQNDALTERFRVTSMPKLKMTDVTWIVRAERVPGGNKKAVAEKLPHDGNQGLISSSSSSPLAMVLLEV